VNTAAAVTTATAVTAADLAAVVAGHLREAASQLRPDVLAALKQACTQERSEQGRRVLEQLVENAQVAAADDVPCCQDTGTVWVSIEAGADACAALQLSGLQEAIDAEVAQVFAEQGLRASTLRDALLDRSNPGTNTPAFVELQLNAQLPREQIVVHTMLKGAGSDNASRVVMLPPAAGEEGIEAALLKTLHQNSSSCPPLIIGIGVGATFDTVAALSKHALLQPLNTLNTALNTAPGTTLGITPNTAPGTTSDTTPSALQSSNPRLAALEARLLAAANATGIGPAGLGGDTTALGVRIATAPCHIAALPVAINLCCHALRSRSTILVG
jgi:tartrate/fumarate subfamily iron-sulfur-dependent hydro-lyase alpha chain